MALKVLLYFFATTVAATGGAGDCKAHCDRLVGELPQALDCRSYRMMLPRPKVGKACTSAYDDAASTACYSKCQGDNVPSRDAKSADFCRKYLQDYPKPTVHKSCKSGYNLGFEKGLQAAETISSQSSSEEEIAEPDAPKEHDPTPEAPPPTPPAVAERRLLVSMPVTVDDAEINLKVYSDEIPAERVAAFCKEHMPDAVDSCIRQLTLHVQRKLAATAEE